MPVISIITPHFNRYELILITAKSILKQSNPNWEWIIVDDGSDNACWGKLQELRDDSEKIRVFRRDRQPKGACACRNIGVENARGEYLLFLDSDDLLAPSAIETRLNFLQQKQGYQDVPIFPSMVFTKTPCTGFLWDDNSHPVSWLEGLFSQTPPTGGTGPVWRKQDLIEIGGWNESLHVWQDLELHLRAHFKGVRFKIIENLQPEIHIRINTPDSISHVNFHSEAKLSSRLIIFTQALSQVSNETLSSGEIKALRRMGGSIFENALTTNLETAYMILSKTKFRELMTEKQCLVAISIYLAFYFRLRKLPPIKYLLLSILKSSFKTTSKRRLMVTPYRYDSTS